MRANTTQGPDPIGVVPTPSWDEVSLLPNVAVFGLLLVALAALVTSAVIMRGHRRRQSLPESELVSITTRRSKDADH